MSLILLILHLYICCLLLNVFHFLLQSLQTLVPCDPEPQTTLKYMSGWETEPSLKSPQLLALPLISLKNYFQLLLSRFSRGTKCWGQRLSLFSTADKTALIQPRCRQHGLQFHHLNINIIELNFFTSSNRSLWLILELPGPETRAALLELFHHVTCVHRTPALWEEPPDDQLSRTVFAHYGFIYSRLLPDKPAVQQPILLFSVRSQLQGFTWLILSNL